MKEKVERWRIIIPDEQDEDEIEDENIDEAIRRMKLKQRNHVKRGNGLYGIE